MESLPQESCFTSSRYNFKFKHNDSVYLYSAFSGHILHFEGANADELGSCLSEAPQNFEEACFSPETLQDLLLGGFVHPPEINQLSEIQDRYQRARVESPIVFTITTTMDCNLGCYYCYESRSDQKLTSTDISSIKDLAEKRLIESGKKSFHVDWYGGEPLMNVEFLEEASLTLQKLCTKLGVRYKASVISNGTCWPEDVEAFVQRHQIHQVQISFDGMRRNHDKRRRYRSKPKDSEVRSSFDKAVNLVEQLLNVTHVDLRYNIDRKNEDDLVPFINFIRERGWFKKEYPLVFQPARLSSYSETSAFMRKSELTLDEFDESRQKVRDAIGEDTLIEESEAPDGYPYPKTSVCAALANDSLVVGAEGALYRCGLQVGETNRTVGEIKVLEFKTIPIRADQVTNSDHKWWKDYDPTKNGTCSACSFLPICFGGCPKKQLEEDSYSIAEQGKYWRSNLSRLVGKKLGIDFIQKGQLSEQDQFRC